MYQFCLIKKTFNISFGFLLTNRYKRFILKQLIHKSLNDYNIFDIVK